MGDPLWPTYDAPADLAVIEAMPLAERGLPGTARGADETSIKEVLEHFAVTWRLEMS